MEETFISQSTVSSQDGSKDDNAKNLQNIFISKIRRDLEPLFFSLFDMIMGAVEDTELINREEANETPFSSLEEYTKEYYQISSSPSQSQEIKHPSEDKISNICKEHMNQVMKATLKSILQIMDTMHNREIKLRNHMRSHYDNIVNTCRVSYRLEREEYMRSNKMKQQVNEKEVLRNHDITISHLNGLLEESKNANRLQEKTIKELLNTSKKLESELHNKINDFDNYRKINEKQIHDISSELELKIKREAYAIFKIIRLENMLKTSEKNMEIKKLEMKSQRNKIKEMKGRLKVSKMIRRDLEKSVEKRMSIRKGSRIMIPVEMLRSNPSLNSSSNDNQRRLLFSTVSPVKTSLCDTQSSLFKPIHNDSTIPDASIVVKVDKTTNTPIDNYDLIMANQVEHLNTLVLETKAELSKVKITNSTLEKQNDAYKQLLTSKTIGMILASQHKHLSKNTESLEANLIFDVYKNEESSGTSTKSLIVSQNRKAVSPHLMLSKRKLKSKPLISSPKKREDK